MPIPPGSSALRALVPLFLLAPAAAAQETATVRGVVVDSLTRAPVEDAYVDLGGGRRAATDRDGRFTLCHVAPGPARLRVTAFRYSAREEPVEVAAGDTARRVLALHGTGAVRIDEGNPVHPGALLIVDGVRVFASASGCEAAPPGMPTLDGLDPDEVENVEVMAGPRAVAVYGPDARHGALLITTRRKAGRPAP